MSYKILALFVLVFLAVLVIMNPVANTNMAVVQTSAAVQVPQAINDAIAIGLTALLTMGTAYLFTKLGIDLQRFAVPIALALSAWVVTELQNVINTIPESYDPTLDIVLKVIVVLLGSVGVLAFRALPKPEPGRLI